MKLMSNVSMETLKVYKKSLNMNHRYAMTLAFNSSRLATDNQKKKKKKFKLNFHTINVKIRIQYSIKLC